MHEKIEQAITQGFMKTGFPFNYFFLLIFKDKKVCEQKFSRAGSTAISIVLIPRGDKVFLYSANAGDARAVLR